MVMTVLAEVLVIYIYTVEKSLRMFGVTSKPDDGCSGDMLSFCFSLGQFSSQFAEDILCLCRTDDIYVATREEGDGVVQWCSTRKSRIYICDNSIDMFSAM
jgi:hypothetical protein